MRRLFEALHAVTERRSEQEVLVLLVEDLHWFDPQSEAFLERLVESFPGSRTLVLANFRPEFSASWMRHSYYRQLSLAPLRDEAVGELLGGLLGVEVSLTPLLAFVLERTAGNPFFVEEVVRALAEDGTLAGGPDGYRLTRPLEQVRVPPSVQAVLAARIDRLPTASKAVLQTAAVIGRTFARPVLAMVTGEPEAALAEALRALTAAELLQEARQEARDHRIAEYRFWHPLTQEVAYQTLLARRRAKLHAAVAEALTEHEANRLDELAAVLAWHWERAGRTLEAARWNLRAGEFAVRSDLTEAQRRWRAAASMLLDVEQTRETLEVATRAHTRLLQFGARTGIDPAEAEGLYAQGRALAERLDDRRPLGALVIMAGSVKFWRGDFQGALLRVQEAVRLGNRTENPDLRAAAWFGLGFVRAYAAPPAEALAATECALAAADGDPERGAALLGYSALARTRQVRAGILARTGRLPEAAAEVEAALRLARPRTETDTVAWALAVLPYLDWLRGAGDGGLGAATEALRLAEDTGNVGALVLALEGVALAHLAAGMPSKAVHACERALAEARGRRSGLFEEARLLVDLAAARLAAGNVGGARAAADEAVSVARQRATPTDECPALLARARARCAAREPQDAVAAELGAALTLARRIGALTYEPFIREELARVRGDDAEFGEALRLFTAIGATGHARRLEAEPVS
jgi:tetratricopeptide (TPR) repeat protein